MGQVDGVIYAKQKMTETEEETLAFYQESNPLSGKSVVFLGVSCA
jgi:hypothetical protein